MLHAPLGCLESWNETRHPMQFLLKEQGRALRHEMLAAELTSVASPRAAQRAASLLHCLGPQRTVGRQALAMAGRSWIPDQKHSLQQDGTYQQTCMAPKRTCKPPNKARQRMKGYTEENESCATGQKAAAHKQ